MFTKDMILSKFFFARMALGFTLAVSFIFYGCSASSNNNPKTTKKKQAASENNSQKELNDLELFTKHVTPEQKLQNLKLLLEKYPASPYAPSAIMRVINLSKGAEKVKYINMAINKYSEAKSGKRNKQTVGMSAGMIFINLYLEQRKMKKALEVANKLIKKFPKFKYLSRLHKKMLDNLSLKKRLGEFVFDKKTGLGEFVMQIDCYMNKYTLVKFYVPVDTVGKALPEANDILMYIPWTGEARRTFTGGINKSYLKFAQREKMTIFTFTNWCHIFSYQKGLYFPTKKAGWYPYLFKMKKRIEQKFGFESRKLFISGQSSGGSMSQRLSAAHPDKIAAAAWNWGTSYISNIPKKMPPMLIMNNWSAYLNYRDNVNWMVKRLRENDNYVLRGYGPARPTGRGFNYHGASKETLDLLEQFIADLRNLRKKNGGEIPAYKNWYKVIDKSGEDKYYSSKEFYNKWKQLPLDAIKNMKSNDPDKLLVFPQLVDKPDRIVLYIGPVNRGRTAWSRFCLWDAMYYLAKNGAIAVSFNPKSDPNCNNAPAILDKVFSNKNWKKLNIYIVGVGSVGEAFINRLKNYDNQRLKGIKLFDPVFRSSVKSYKGIPLTVYIPGSSNGKEENGIKHYNPKISCIKAVELIAKK